MLVHKDNPNVCSDPTSVTPGGTRVIARKDKEKALNKKTSVIKGKLSSGNTQRCQTSDQKGTNPGDAFACHKD